MASTRFTTNWVSVRKHHAMIISGSRDAQSRTLSELTRKRLLISARTSAMMTTLVRDSTTSLKVKIPTRAMNTKKVTAIQTQVRILKNASLKSNSSISGSKMDSAATIKSSIKIKIALILQNVITVSY